MEINNYQRHIYSLFEISKSIRQVINNTFKGYYWIKAEIVKLNFYPKSGHCYPDLVEKEQGKIKAQIRANIWSSNFIKINNKFKSATGEPLKDGLHILFLARVVYHEHYGLSLNIIDIEPSFTIGEMAKEKQDTIRRLQQENVFFNNKNLSFALIPKRLAIISVETSKGYKDFLNVINNNQHGYIIEHKLFPALLQGDAAINSIIKQFDIIIKDIENFEALCIIRGGGGDVGLNAFDSYLLAHKVATFPLPVITGIGHSTNQTVVQMVAFANKITPTEAGHFIIQRFLNFEERLAQVEEQMFKYSKERLKTEDYKIDNLLNIFKSKTEKYISANRFFIKSFESKIISLTVNILNNQKIKLFGFNKSMDINVLQQLKLENIRVKTSIKIILKNIAYLFNKEKILLSNQENKLQLLKPENILKRGYSITFYSGKVLKNAKALKIGNKITTQLYKGVVKSKVTNNK